MIFFLLLLILFVLLLLLLLLLSLLELTQEARFKTWSGRSVCVFGAGSQTGSALARLRFSHEGVDILYFPSGLSCADVLAQAPRGQ